MLMCVCRILIKITYLLTYLLLQRVFFTNRQSAATENRYGKDVDQPFNKIMKAVQDDHEKIWTSVELQEMYELEGGKNLSRGTLISELEE